MERVYRFRSIKRLLGRSQELDKQEFYFASPDELNDPAEETFPFVWEGDKIIWTNFFRHYLSCLHWKCLDFILMAGHKRIAEIPLPMMYGESPALSTVMSRMHGEIVQKVLNNTNFEELIKVLDQSAYPLGNSEVLFLCQIFHWEAIEVIRAVHQGFGYPLPGFSDEPSPVNPISGASVILESRGSTDFPDELFHEIIQLYLGDKFLGMKYYLNQNNIDNQQATDIITENYGYLNFDFPQIHLEHLYTLVYPNWYTVCFSKNCSNTASWASYGDSHKGVCLIFGVEHDSKEAGLTLNTVSRNDGKSVRLSRGYHQFYDVSYGPNDKKIDFFRSLGRVPHGILIENWYSDDRGNISKCAAPLQEDVDSWRQEYWNQFFPVIAQKSKAWHHEEETRLIRHGLLDDLDNNDRKSTYDFSSLIGIVFGVRTRDSEKIKVIDTIRRKCAKYGRKTFEFYQAYFDEKGNIGKCEIRHLGSFD
ncbi:MAG: DUF2971 domain-containing protein [Bacteroidetes bacterium]|nr:DUF2971 domain-containing protein [Bacteroidota bacterium]MDE2671774.1 DUF2971 domain-containing protein [Bacteroidota bacterium]